MLDAVWEVLTSSKGVGFILFVMIAGWVRSAWLKKIWKDNRTLFSRFFQATQENIPQTSKAAEKWLKKPNKSNKKELWKELMEWGDLLEPLDNKEGTKEKDKEK